MPEKYIAYCLALESTRNDSRGDDDDDDDKVMVIIFMIMSAVLLLSMQISTGLVLKSYLDCKCIFSLIWFSIEI